MSSLGVLDILRPGIELSSEKDARSFRMIYVGFSDGQKFGDGCKIMYFVWDKLVIGSAWILLLVEIGKGFGFWIFCHEFLLLALFIRNAAWLDWTRRYDNG